jgi:hypothetical protein
MHRGLVETGTAKTTLGSIEDLGPTVRLALRRSLALRRGFALRVSLIHFGT